jgi:uncharacterized protein (DUF983 family)
VTDHRTPSAQAGGVSSFWRVALRGRCPRCGEGLLFNGLLDVAPAGAIFLLGALTVIGAFLVEFRLEPPFWVHLVLWPALLIPGAVATMRVAKAALVWVQWRHRSGGPR